MVNTEVMQIVETGSRLTAQRNGEEVESIPSPTQPPDEEKIPLMFVKTPKDGPWIHEFGSWWFQRGDSAGYVARDLTE